MITTKASGCLFLNTCYSNFLKHFYQSNPELVNATYSVQLAALNATRFGDADFYSHGLKAAGWAAGDIILNCEPLQHAWWRENVGSEPPAQLLEIAVHQVRAAQPEVVYLQDLSLADASFLGALRPHVQLIAGQIACPVPNVNGLHNLDAIFTSFPHYVNRFRADGIAAWYQPLAFEPKIRGDVSENSEGRPHRLSFIGGLSSLHKKGAALLEAVAADTPLELWGYGKDTLPEGSILRDRHRGELWGRDLFQGFVDSEITLNRHVDVAENYANNMRLFEATGCGAMLITDYKDNLAELFEIGKEVVAYRNADECVELVHYYLEHPEEAQAIAERGQIRTLTDHTYSKRMEYTGEVLSRLLRGNAFRKSGRKPKAQVNSQYRSGRLEDFSDSVAKAWQDPSIPEEQRFLVEEELHAMRHGTVPIPFHALSEAVGRCKPQPKMRLLEVGCASGYGHEVIDYLLRQKIDYTGVDYSESFIEMARNLYPDAKFNQADGAQLPFADKSFPVTISSCVLLHVPNYAEHIRETIRVTKDYIVAHRTPLCRERETHCIEKSGYGVSMMEIRFNEKEFNRLFEEGGFVPIYRYVIYENPEQDAFVETVVYVRKEMYSVCSVERSFANMNLIPLKKKEKFRAETWNALNLFKASSVLEEDFATLRTIQKTAIDRKLNPHAALETWKKRRSSSTGMQSIYSALDELTYAQMWMLPSRWNLATSYSKKKLTALVNWLMDSRELTNLTYDLEPQNMVQLNWVLAQVARVSYTEAEGVIAEVLSDQGLRSQLQQQARKRPNDLVDLQPKYGRRLLWYGLVRLLKPKRLIESGIDKGLGTCLILAALKRNAEEGNPGHLFGLDIQEDSGWLSEGFYPEALTIEIGSSWDYLEAMVEPVDLFIHDSDHSAAYEAGEYDRVWHKLNPNALVISDNGHVTDVLPRRAASEGKQFVYFHEIPKDHFYPGAGAGIAYGGAK